MTTSAERDYDRIAAYYDLARIDLSPYVRFYSGLLRPDVGSILDIGCGTGTITAALARQRRAMAQGDQARVMGLDLSQAMLDAARQRDPAITWMQGDMTSLPDCGPLDLVVCCYNSLQHLDAAGLGKAFRSVRRILREGGRFAFDLYRPNFDYIRRQRDNDLTRLVTDADGRTLEIREDSVFNEDIGQLIITWRIVPAGRAQDKPLASVDYRLWQHRPETVDAALAAAGLAPIERYGDLDGRPWAADARKQVLVCTTA